MYYYRNRYYHPQLEGFVTRDPIGYAGSDWNLYEYVESKPVHVVDPTGLEGKPDEFYVCWRPARDKFGKT